MVNIILFEIAAKINSAEAFGPLKTPFLFSAALPQNLPAYQSLSAGLGYMIPLLIVLLVVFLSVVLPLLFIVPTFLGWRQNRQLLKTGEPARAKILKLWDTGVTVNDNPQVGLLLEVYAANFPVYQAETKSIISRLHISQIQTGAAVEVRFDRQDPTKIALVM